MKCWEFVAFLFFCVWFYFSFCHLVHKPEKVCWVEAAGTVRDGVRAYTALHYLSQVSPGKTVLVMDGASVGNNCVIIIKQLQYGWPLP